MKSIKDVLEFCQTNAELFRLNLKSPVNEPNSYKAGFDNGYNLGCAQTLELLIEKIEEKQPNE